MSEINLDYSLFRLVDNLVVRYLSKDTDFCLVSWIQKGLIKYVNKFVSDYMLVCAVM